MFGLPASLNLRETYTATGTTAVASVIDLITCPPQKYTIQVSTASGAATSWSINLEGSLDGTNWTALLTHTNVTPGIGKNISGGGNFSPMRYLRINCTAIVLGTSPGLIVDAIGVQ